VNFGPELWNGKLRGGLRHFSIMGTLVNVTDVPFFGFFLGTILDAME
jgi:hypothetical protein